MSPKSATGAQPKEKQTVESLIAPLNSHAQASTKDARVRDVYDHNLKLASGVARVFLDPQDGDDQLAATLSKRNITLDDAMNLVADTTTMLDLQQERDAKELALRASQTKLDAGRIRAHEQGQKVANLIRGLVGTKSDILDRFGIARLGKGGKKGPRKPKASPGGNEGTPAK